MKIGKNIHNYLSGVSAMNHEGKADSTQRMPNTSVTATKKWYHLKLFPKFALIFFLIVAIPVIVIAIDVSYQSKAFILESVNQFITDMTSVFEKVTQDQQRANEAVFDSTGQDLIQISHQALFQLKNNLIALNRNLYEAQIAQFTTESQATDASVSSTEAMVAAYLKPIA
jgi:hypothetical protein